MSDQRRARKERRASRRAVSSTHENDLRRSTAARAVQSKFGRTVTIGRTAILTRGHNGRAACHYCGPCERGCVTFSYFSSPFTTVADALKSGNCTLITDAVVRHVDVDKKENRARGVTYIDRNTRKTYQISARSVILCAQALESTRILLNSKNEQHPDGLGNSSGLLGRFLMDHAVGAGASGGLAIDFKKSAADPNRPNGIYIIRGKVIWAPIVRGAVEKEAVLTGFTPAQIDRLLSSFKGR